MFLDILLLILSAFSPLIESSLDVNNIDKQLLENASAVVRYSHTNLSIKELDKVVETSEKAVTVMNAKGASHADFYSYFEDKVDKVKNIKIRIFDKSGKLIRKVSKKEIENIAYSDNFSLALDTRIYRFHYEQNTYPYTIVYSYEKYTDNSYFLKRWFPVPNIGVSVEHSSFTVETAIPGQEFLLDKNNVEDCKIEVSANKVSATLEAKKAIKYESHAPHYLEIFPHLRVVPKRFSSFGIEGEITDWESYGKWMYDNMLKSRGDLPKELIEELNSIIPHNASMEEKARLIYNYVTNNTRYVSIQLGIGGFQPFPSKDVYELKYGDCKALSFYTKNIMEYYGVPAIYTEINSNKYNDAGYKTSVPGPGQGNHIILCLPELYDTIFLECTANVPFGFSPSSTSGKNCLLIKETGGFITSTPSYEDYENYSVQTVDVDLTDINNIQLDWNGKYYNQRYREIAWIETLKGEKRDKYIKSHLFSNIPSPNILQYETSLNEEEICQSEHAIIETSTLIEKAGYYLMVPVDFVRIDIPEDIELERENKLYIRDGKKDSFEINIPLLAKFVPIDESLSMHFENNFGVININQVNFDDKIQLKGSILYKSGTFDKNQTSNYILFREQILKWLSMKITLQAKGP